MKKLLPLWMVLLVLPVFMLYAQGSGDGKIQVDYSVTYDNQGSRSEAQHYTLKINGEIVADVFDRIEADGVLYHFTSRSQVWGSDGYVSAGEYTVPYGRGGQSITSEEKKTGWYVSGKRKKGTPDSWCWVNRGEVSAFVDPEKINEFAESQGFEPMPRSVMQDLMRD